MNDSYKRHCSQCGCEVEVSAKFCGNCGSKVSQAPQFDLTPHHQSSDSPPSNGDLTGDLQKVEEQDGRPSEAATSDEAPTLSNTFLVVCPSCGHSEEFGAEMLGKRATCSCGRVFRIESAAPNSSLQPPPVVAYGGPVRNISHASGKPDNIGHKATGTVRGSESPSPNVRQKKLVPCPACDQPMVEGEPCASCAVIAENQKRIEAERERAKRADLDRWKWEDTKNAAGCAGNGCLWTVAIAGLLIMVGPWLLAVFPLVALVAICAFVVALIFAFFFKR